MRRPAAAAAVLTLALGAAGALAATGGAQVLVVGDSLGVGTEPYLEQERAGTPISNDSMTSRTSAEGLEVLRSAISPDDEAVVFALGTNDDPSQPQVLADHLAEAASIAAGRCLVVATVARPPANGVSVEALNDAIRAFAAANPDVELVDWYAEVTAQPDLLVDGVHATPEGYALRASLLAQAVDTCLVSDAAADTRRRGERHGDLSEGRVHPVGPPGAGEPERAQISTARAYRILADAVSSQIAIGPLR